MRNDYLSQIDCECIRTDGHRANPAWSIDMHHGIDLKNPFTMSKKRANARERRPSKEPNLVSSSLEKLGEYALRPNPSRSLIARDFPGSSCPARCSDPKNGGAYRDRTDDLMLAKQPLSQLS